MNFENRTKKEQKMKKRYVLTGDGYEGRHGTKLYLLGVFDDKETAERLAEEHKCTITEIEANRFFSLFGMSYHGYHSHKENNYYLGGYVE